MLAPGNYVQWKSIIKRYIDTKPNNELIHYCLQNPPYKFKWTEKIVPVAKGIDNDIYSIVDACPNTCEMWKAIESLKHGESINVQDLETNLYWGFRKFTSRDGESLESYYSRVVNVVGAWENVGTSGAALQLGFCVIIDKNYGHCEQGMSKTENGYDREQDDQDDNDDLAKERDLLASLIEKLKCEIDDSKNRNKFLETSNKALVDKLKSKIEDFKTKIKKFRNHQYHFKEAINGNCHRLLSCCFKDLKKFQFKLDSSKERILVYTDIGCYNDNLALMLAPESDKTIRLA
ncbi:hypothetical protein Tco_0811654 [Tanacetum coccineum]